jgi:hypothetical protein
MRNIGKYENMEAATFEQGNSNRSQRDDKTELIKVPLLLPLIL